MPEPQAPEDDRVEAEQAEEADAPVGEEPVSCAGFYAALAEVLRTRALTNEFSQMIRERLCRSLVRKLPTSKVELVTGGRTKAANKSGRRCDIGATDAAEELTQEIGFGVLHKLPHGVRSTYDEDGNQVPRELNLPLLQKYYDQAATQPSEAERDSFVFDKFRGRAWVEWQSLLNDHHPLTRLRRTLRDKLKTAVARHGGGIVECVEGTAGDGVLLLVGTKGEPSPDLDLRLLAKREGLTCDGRGVLSGEGSPKDHVPGLPSPGQMGELLTRLLKGGPSNPAPLEAISVFAFIDLCFLAFDLAVPGKVELAGEDESDEGAEIYPDDIPIPQDKQTPAIIPELGVEPKVNQGVERVIWLLREKDREVLPDKPPGDSHSLGTRCKWQQTLAQGVLWEDQDLRGKATGKYSVADFLRISGFKRNQAYQRWEQIKHSIKEAMEGLEGEDKLLALSLLMRRFLPWKPEIVADIALQSLTTTRDLNHV